MDNPSDNEDEKIEDELKEINDYYDNNTSNTSAEASPFVIMGREQQNQQTEETKVDDDLNDSLKDEGSDIYSDEEEEEDERVEIEISCEMLSTKVKETDENEYFKNVMSKLYNNNKDDMTNIIQQLSDKQKNFMEKLLQTQSVTVELNGETKTVHRRIIKARRRR